MFTNKQLANEDLFSCGVKEGLALCNLFCSHYACHLASSLQYIMCLQRTVAFSDSCRATMRGWSKITNHTHCDMSVSMLAMYTAAVWRVVQNVGDL